MDKNYLSKIAIKIKSQRECIGITLDELSKKTNISKSTLQRYETGGISNIPLDKLEILAKGLSLTPVELLGINNLDL